MATETEQVAVESKPMLHKFEAASVLLGGFSPWSLRRHAQRRNVRVVRLGNRVFLDSEELERIRREGLPSLSAQREE